MPGPVKKKRRFSRLALATVAVIVFCATGAAAIIEWVPHMKGIPADILIPRGAEVSANDPDPIGAQP